MPAPAVTWKTFDEGDFTMELPSNMKREEVQGIDSQVGQYEGGGLKLSYDYGWFGGNFSEQGTSYKESWEYVDGRFAQIVFYKESRPDYGGPLISGLFISNVEATRDSPSTPPADGNPAETSLKLHIDYAEPNTRSVAERVMRSVNFSM